MEPVSNFLRALIAEDLRTGRHQRVATRFPPEPNGYLHIGHAKSISVNFGLALEFGGTCNLRFDDTNPAKEDVEYVDSIQNDVRWLGYDWDDRLYYASDYFERMYQLGLHLIREGRAYVCSLDEAAIRAYRGTVSEPGRPSPGRDRSVAENLDLFTRMRAGEFPDGAHVLRGRCDMSAANMKMRDPLLYRIRHDTHHRTGDAWPIYPMYDYAHPLSDAFEGITHSICTLEFENNRELYDWVIRETGVPCQPRQYEMARLALSYTVMSKRKLLRLVQDGDVSGWDDPRMPTLAGLRRRGVTPEAIREFCERIGVARANSVVEIEAFEVAIRDDLNLRAPRMMAVLHPLRVIVESWPEGHVELLEAACWPQDVPNEGSRVVPFTRELFIEREDFAEVPPPKFHRLSPGGEVRLRYGYVIRCVGVERDADGAITALRCTHDPETRGGDTTRKIAGTIHWVSADHALDATVRVYDRLFRTERPDAGEEDFRVHLNPASLTTLTAKVEPSLGALGPGAHVQFERIGYFYTDPLDSREGAPVFNRVVGLKDSWVKAAPKIEPPKAEKAVVASKAPVENRFTALGVGADDAALLDADPALAGLFDAALAVHPAARGVASWLLGEIPKEKRSSLPFSGGAIGALVALIDDGTISGRIAKDVLAEMLEGGGEPRAIIERRGLVQISDRDAIVRVARGVVERNPGQLAAYRAGKTALLGFFVGEVMKATKGRANPGVVQEAVREVLG